MRAKKIVLVFICTALVVYSSYCAYNYYKSYRREKERRALLEKRKYAWDRLEYRLRSEISLFKGTAGIVIKDMETGWKFAHNENERFPSASMVKIPIMASCYLAISEGRLSPDHAVKLKASDRMTGSGVLKLMSPGASFTIEELNRYMICESDNTASNMIINALGLEYVQNSFKTFGLKATNISREIADYQSRSRGIENFTTAGEMASLLEKIYEGRLVSAAASRKCLEMMKLQRVNDRIPAYLPVDVAVAHKTGLERGVCHDAGVVYTRKGDFIICVLTRHSDANSKKAKDFIGGLALSAYEYVDGK